MLRFDDTGGAAPAVGERVPELWPRVGKQSPFKDYRQTPEVPRTVVSSQLPEEWTTTNAFARLKETDDDYRTLKRYTRMHKQTGYHIRPGFGGRISVDAPPWMRTVPLEWRQPAETAPYIKVRIANKGVIKPLLEVDPYAPPGTKPKKLPRYSTPGYVPTAEDRAHLEATGRPAPRLDATSTSVLGSGYTARVHRDGGFILEDEYTRAQSAAPRDRFGKTSAADYGGGRPLVDTLSSEAAAGPVAEMADSSRHRAEPPSAEYFRQRRGRVGVGDTAPRLSEISLRMGSFDGSVSAGGGASRRAASAAGGSRGVALSSSLTASLAGTLGTSLDRSGGGSHSAGGGGGGESRRSGPAGHLLFHALSMEHGCRPGQHLEATVAALQPALVGTAGAGSLAGLQSAAAVPGSGPPGPGALSASIRGTGVGLRRGAGGPLDWYTRTR